MFTFTVTELKSKTKYSFELFGIVILTVVIPKAQKN